MVMNSKGKEGKPRDWEQPSSAAGKAALVTGQVRPSWKPDLRARFCSSHLCSDCREAPGWRGAARQDCCEGTGRSGPSKLHLARTTAVAAGAFYWVTTRSKSAWRCDFTPFELRAGGKHCREQPGSAPHASLSGRWRVGPLLPASLEQQGSLEIRNWHPGSGHCTPL